MTADQAVSFGQLLRRHRLAACLTQAALAEQAGLSERAISDLERGVKRTPHLETVAVLARALALPSGERAAFVDAARPSSVPSEPGGTRDSTQVAAARGARDGAAFAAPGGAPRSGPEQRPVRPLCGRHRERWLLERHLAGEGPPLLLLAGEPGIGKSRLLQEAAGWAHRQGWTVLAGGCQRRGGQEPYAPLLQALERHLHLEHPARQRAALHGCAWLVRLLPELAGVIPEALPAWTLPPAQERRLMFAAVARLLANVAGPAGTLLVLDDLQWADTDAFDLLTTVLHRAAEPPPRVIGAYRDTEVAPEHPLARLLADLAHAGLAAHHALGPLGLDEARQLLAGLLAGHAERGMTLRERCVQRSGGVPFYVVSFAQALQAGALGGTGGAAVPWDMAQGIRQRVAALPQAAQAVLGVAAVLGRAVQPVLLRMVARRPEEEVLAALEAGCQARLLEEAEEDGYHFAHDVVREVLEADVGLARRRVLHRRAAESLEQQPSEQQVELLAYHYDRGGVQERALLYLEQAGDKAEGRAAHAAAEGYFHQVVERLERLGRVLDAARVREKLGRVLWQAARFDAALAVLDEAIESYRTAKDLESLLRVTSEIGFVHVMRGTPARGIARLEALLHTAATLGPSREMAALYGQLAGAYFHSGRYVEAHEAAERGAALARTLGDTSLLARANIFLACAIFAAGCGKPVGRVDEAIRITEEAIQLSEAVGDYRFLWTAWANLGYFCLIRGEFAASTPYLQRAAAIADQMGDLSFITFGTAMAGWRTFLLGEWDQASVESERAVTLSRQAGVPWAAAYALLHRGQLALAEGHWEEAGRHLEEALSLAEQKEDLQAVRQATRHLAELELLAGRPAAAHARLVPLLDRPGLEEYEVTALLPMLAWASLELGDAPRAEQVVEQAIRRARPERFRLVLLDALRVSAMVGIRKGHWAEAEGALDEGLALARGMRYPYAEARLLYLYGLCRTRQGAHGPAQERLEAALAIFRRLGARKDLERAEELLTALI